MRGSPQYRKCRDWIGTLILDPEPVQLGRRGLDADRQADRQAWPRHATPRMGGMRYLEGSIPIGYLGRLVEKFEGPDLEMVSKPGCRPN